MYIVESIVKFDPSCVGESLLS